MVPTQQLVDTMEWSTFISKFCIAFQPLWDGKVLTGEEECLMQLQRLLEEGAGYVSLDRLADLCPFFGEGEHALESIIDLCATGYYISSASLFCAF